MSVNSDGISWGGILARFFFALLLVYATWNPMGFSFTHWVIVPLFGSAPDAPQIAAPVKFLLGLLLLVGWVLYLQATRRALGLMGALLVGAICAGVVWLLTAYRVVTMEGSAIPHLILISLAILLAMGMSWSHLSRRMSGQIDTDTVE